MSWSIGSYFLPECQQALTDFPSLSLPADPCIFLISHLDRSDHFWDIGSNSEINDGNHLKRNAEDM